MREHDAFRTPCGTRGVDGGGERIGGCRRRWHLGTGACKRLGKWFDPDARRHFDHRDSRIANPDSLQAHEIGCVWGEGLPSRVAVDDQQARARMCQDESDIRRTVVQVDRDDDEPERERRDVGCDPIRAVGKRDRHAVGWLQSRSDQSAAGRLDALCHSLPSVIAPSGACRVEFPIGHLVSASPYALMKQRAEGGGSLWSDEIDRGVDTLATSLTCHLLNLI